jgi:hypothetical protein
MLYTPERHEPLSGGRFTERVARAAIGRVVSRAERELDRGLWPRDDEDRQRDDEGRASTLYWGAAGIAWALDLLERDDVDALVRRLETDADDPDHEEAGVWFGLAGILAVAEHRWPDSSRRDRLAQLARASLSSAALEPMVGHPGYMLLAAQLYARGTSGCTTSG